MPKNKISFFFLCIWQIGQLKEKVNSTMKEWIKKTKQISSAVFECFTKTSDTMGWEGSKASTRSQCMAGETTKMPETTILWHMWWQTHYFHDNWKKLLFQWWRINFFADYYLGSKSERRLLSVSTKRIFFCLGCGSHRTQRITTYTGC